jgi:hypothetical protein
LLSIAFIEAGTHSSVRAQEHKIIREQHDLFVSAAVFIFKPLMIKSINSHFHFTHPGNPEQAPLIMLPENRNLCNYCRNSGSKQDGQVSAAKAYHGKFAVLNFKE